MFIDCESVVFLSLRVYIGAGVRSLGTTVLDLDSGFILRVGRRLLAYMAET